VVINSGPAARAGNPIPIPDAMIAPDLQEFATVDVAARASSEGGSGEDMGDFAGGIDWDRKPEEVKTLVDKEPDPDEFIPVEKEPAFDMARLQKLVVYPDMARRAGIEGTVLVRALVDKTGKIIRTRIDMSDNKALDAAAQKAVMDYGHSTPGIMNGQPVSVWVNIPITFRLK
jgi:protein TonB